MKILICGDRNWTDPGPIETAIIKLAPTIVIHGACRGADEIAGQIATEKGINVIPFRADWDKHGKAAGPIRNRLMLAQKPEMVLAFHTNLKESKGTQGMVFAANLAGVPVWILGVPQ